MDLNNIKRLILRGYRERWTTQRFMLETGLDVADLQKIVKQMRAEGWDIRRNAYPVKFSLGDAWQFTGDFCIIGDVHVPFTDWDFAGRVATVAVNELDEPRRLIIAGDLFNFDAFSQYIQVMDTVGWAEEREAARTIIREWLLTFEQIYILMGNHDRRLQKFTAGAFDENDILALITTNENVTMSRYGWCEITSGGERWRITHQKNYSVNALNVASALSDKYQCHVMTHHEHHGAMGWNRFKTYMTVNNGALVDPEKLAYVKLDDSKSAGMAKGFTILRNGAPLLIGEYPLTDWTKYGISNNGN